jgi:uncharacterized membrane protein
MRVWILVVLLLLSVAGCTVWVRPDTTENEFRRDLADCEYEATLATASLAPGPAQSSNKFEVMEQCMRKKGYRHKFR